MQPSTLTRPFDLEDLGVFDGFYRPWLERAAAELSTLGEQEQIVDPDQFVLSVLADLRLRLVALASKSLIWSYRTAQGSGAEFPFDDQTIDQIPLDGRHLPRERYDRHHADSVPRPADEICLIVCRCSSSFLTRPSLRE